MRIAYVTPYQGPSLLERRPIVRNRSVSNRIKIELIAGLLVDNSHDVEIISHGEVIENQWTFYPGFAEPQRFHPSIPIEYISALPIRRINGMWSAFQAKRALLKKHQIAPFDIIVAFNLKPPQLACTRLAARRLGIPTVLEYEDDAFVNVIGEGAKGGFPTRYHHKKYLEALRLIGGCIAVSPHLLNQIPSNIPKLLLRGVVGNDLIKVSGNPLEARRNWILFSGTHTKSNGVEQLISAWRYIQLPGWELHITGHGELTEKLKAMALAESGIVFHGFVSREKLLELMSHALICINPHAVSETPGNVFAFKLIEYLAAGAHVVTTPMGQLETELEKGLTYMADNSAECIANTITETVKSGRWRASVPGVVHSIYGPSAVAKVLDKMLRDVAGLGKNFGHRIL